MYLGCISGRPQAHLGIITAPAAQADIWSIGVSLWECAVGRYPFGSPGGGGGGARDEASAGCFWELLHLIVESEPPPLPEGNYSPPLRSLVGRCLQKAGAERPTAGEISADKWIEENARDDRYDMRPWLHVTKETSTE